MVAVRRLARAAGQRNNVYVHTSLYRRADGDDGLGLNTAIIVNPSGELVAATNKLHIPVTAGYYDDSRFFRVVKGRWAQFGINGDPAIARAWRDRPIADRRRISSPVAPQKRVQVPVAKTAHGFGELALMMVPWWATGKKPEEKLVLEL